MCFYILYILEIICIYIYIFVFLYVSIPCYIITILMLLSQINLVYGIITVNLTNFYLYNIQQKSCLWYYNIQT